MHKKNHLNWHFIAAIVATLALWALLLFPAIARADWPTKLVEVGATEFRGEKLYKIGAGIETARRLQWKVSYIKADTTGDIDEGGEWYQLSFQQGFKLPLPNLFWFVGGSYTLGPHGELAPGLASKGNFHIGFYRDFGKRARLSIDHDSNGDLETKRCTKISTTSLAYTTAQTDAAAIAALPGGVRQLEPVETVQRVCVGKNNTGLNFPTLSFKF